ncbi:hypothetical protein CRYUN_Cryun09bG0099800 [Craigia yunnanensis]
MGGIGVIFRNGAGAGAVMGAYVCSKPEGDALGIIKKLQGEENDLSPIGTLMEEAKARARRFHFCKFLHTGRMGNMVAHRLVNMV